MNDNDFILRTTIKSVVALLLFMALLTISSTTTTSQASHDILEFVPMKNSMEFRAFDVVRATKNRKDGGWSPTNYVWFASAAPNDVLHYALLLRYRLPASWEALWGLRLCSKDLQLY